MSTSQGFTRDWAKEASLKAHSSAARFIRGMKQLRDVEIRPNRIKFDLTKSQNYEGVLAFTRGQVMEDANACEQCKGGFGPFAKCVVVKGLMRGSCANCHYGGKGSGCSFRKLGSVNAGTY
jgi:hypothetical protein